MTSWALSADLRSPQAIASAELKQLTLLGKPLAQSIFRSSFSSARQHALGGGKEARQLDRSRRAAYNSRLNRPGNSTLPSRSICPMAGSTRRDSPTDLAPPIRPRQRFLCPPSLRPDDNPGSHATACSQSRASARIWRTCTFTSSICRQTAAGGRSRLDWSTSSPRSLTQSALVPIAPSRQRESIIWASDRKGALDESLERRHDLRLARTYGQAAYAGLFRLSFPQPGRRTAGLTVSLLKISSAPSRQPAISGRSTRRRPPAIMRWTTTVQGNAVAQASFGKPIAERRPSVVSHRSSRGPRPTTPTPGCFLSVGRSGFGSYLDPDIDRLGDLDLAVTVDRRETDGERHRRPSPWNTRGQAAGDSG